MNEGGWFSSVIQAPSAYSEVLHWVVQTTLEPRRPRRRLWLSSLQCNLSNRAFAPFPCISPSAGYTGHEGHADTIPIGMWDVGATTELLRD